MKKILVWLVITSLLLCGCTINKLNDGASYDMKEAGKMVLDAWEELKTNPNRKVENVKKQFYKQIYDAVDKAEEIYDGKNKYDERILDDMRVIKNYIQFLDVFGKKPNLDTSVDIEDFIEDLKEQISK